MRKWGRTTYLIVDTDAHYLDSILTLAEYMDEPWRERVKNANGRRMVPESLGDGLVEGRIRRDDLPYQVADDMVPEQIPKVMERLGIDASIMITNRLLLLGHLSVRDLAVAFCNAYIDYMLDKVVDPARGIYTVVVVPWQDPEEGAATIERAGAHPGVVGVCFPSSGANPPLGDIRYNPVYEAAQHHDLPVIYHSAPAVTLIEGASYQDGLQRLVEAHSLGFAISNMIQLTSVLMQGVPERFPKLRFIFQEAGVFWAPMMMWRLDDFYLKRRSEAPLLRGLPSEYVLDRFYFGTQPLETPKNPKHLEAVFDMVHGHTNFMFSSDYPHFDYDDPSAILKLPFLNAEAKANVLATNATRIFNFRKGGVQPWEGTSSQASETSPRADVSSSR